MPAPQLCLDCARRKLAGRPPRPCNTCSRLNIDPLAAVRASAARPWPPAYIDAAPITPRVVADR